MINYFFLSGYLPAEWVKMLFWLTLKYIKYEKQCIQKHFKKPKKGLFTQNMFPKITPHRNWVWQLFSWGIVSFFSPQSSSCYSMRSVFFCLSVQTDPLMNTPHTFFKSSSCWNFINAHKEVPNKTKKYFSVLFQLACQHISYIVSAVFNNKLFTVIDSRSFALGYHLWFI